MDGRGKTSYFSNAHIKGRAKLEWLEKNNFTEEYTPTVRSNAIRKINASNNFHETVISKCTSWKNAKHILINNGLGRRYDGD